VGGERLVSKKVDILKSGSAPRGRGTVLPGETLRNLLRFSPAWAGNGDCRSEMAFSATVQPRVGGERLDVRVAHVAVRGSAPRGRGTDKARDLMDTNGRFSPAWAGNGLAEIIYVLHLTVQPRVGGERRAPLVSIAAPRGSAPRGRGTGR